MADARQDRIAAIIGRSILATEVLAADYRDRIVRRMLSIGPGAAPGRHINEVRAILDEFEPILARTLTDADLAAWISGQDVVARQLPEVAIDALAGRAGAAAVGRVPAYSTLAKLDDGGPIVRFPVIEEAAENLIKRNIVTRDVFDALVREEKAQAFTVARIISDDTIDTIRNTLVETVQEGASLDVFQKKLGEDLQGSFIGPAHLENVYRTNIQAAFHTAHDQLADHPVVREIFPYQEYLPIHDARTRPEHLELGKLGLDGTGIFRRDDPMWALFSPPWSWMCRCGVTLQTVEAAARKGVKEAQRWLETGQAPAVPEWRLDQIPFRPAPDWVSGQRRLGLATKGHVGVEA